MRQCKRYLILVFVMISGLLPFSGLQAQKSWDHLVISGLEYYEQDEFKMALESFDDALRITDSLSSEIIPQAYYFRARTLLSRFSEAALEGDSLFRWEHPNVILDAHSDLQNAGHYDSEGKWKKQIAVEFRRLYAGMVRGGLQLLNEGNREVYALLTRQAIHTSALPFLTAAIEIEADSFVGYDLRSQIYLSLGDSTHAEEDLKQGIQNYKKHPPQKTDMLFAYMYIRLARIYKLRDQDFELAIEILESGERHLHEEYRRLRRKKRKYAKSFYQSEILKYRQAQKDLNYFRLDILLNHPDLMEKALDQFKKAIQDSPEDYLLHVAYASLLGQTNLEKAVEVYKKAIIIEPEGTTALFNLGVLYFNTGLDLRTEAGELEDKKESQKLEIKAMEYFNLAKKPLEKAWDLEPDLAIAKALSSIAILFGDLSAQKKWKEEIRILED